MLAKHVAFRGYSIVEMGIVLAVLGLLLGSVLVPLSNRLQGANRDEAKQQLEQIEAALLGYAYHHVTNPVDVTMSLASRVAHAKIPGGRSYLPCPDINGDGLEDRFGRLDTFSTTGPPLTPIITLGLPGVVITLATGPNPATRERTLVRDTVHNESRVTIAVTASPSSRDVNLLVSGHNSGCASDKGSVPWATLGTPPQDPWGNRYTYRVDPMFSNKFMGFGTETRSDPLDPRFGLSITVSNSTTLTVYQRRPSSIQTTRFFTSYSYPTAFIDDNPGIVCTLASNAGCSVNVTLDNSNRALFNPVTDITLTMFDVYPNITVARLYEPADVINGMAFVILSHGPNGLGALPHHQGANFISSGVSLACITPSNGGMFSSTLPENDNIDPACRSGSATATNHSFVKVPVNNSNNFFFDDEMRFMTGDHLIGTLARRGFQHGQPWIPPGP